MGCWHLRLVGTAQAERKPETRSAAQPAGGMCKGRYHGFTEISVISVICTEISGADGSPEEHRTKVQT